jgi:glycosyltransferase involved in cell wall biosynthesis
MGSMKVGVIAAEMEGHSTGVGRYLEGLLGGLDGLRHGSQWHLFFQGDPHSVALADGSTVIPHFAGHHGSRVLWEQIRLPRLMARYEIDVIFGPSYSIPLYARKPSAVTIHDLSFELLPDEFAPRERWRRRVLARRSARVANKVFTDTKKIGRMVAERYRVPPERLAVIPLGIDGGKFSPQPSDEDEGVLTDLGVRRPYVLWAGTLLERRLPHQILLAFNALQNTWPNLQLVIGGSNRMRNPHRLQTWIDELGVGEAVRQLGWVAERLLAPLYRCAELGFYVSRHEGFGIPPLECLACGTPVVVSRGLALDDRWPDYPYRCDELSEAAIENTARKILEDRSRAAEILSDGPPIARAFDWEWCARRLVKELEGIASA